MSEGRVTFARDGAIARITLDRPDKLNALTPAMLAELRDAADRIERDDGIRVAVLGAAGERAFCVGADIDAWAGADALHIWRHWVRDGHAVFDRTARLRPPLIAAIEGLALGGGLELAATADLRIAGANAAFGLPEADVGVVPGWSGTQRLVRAVGAAPVKLMALAGERLDAHAAERAGVVHRVVPAGTALDAALALAARIAARAPVAVQLTKQLINAAEGEDTAATLEALASGVAAGTQDIREGVASFREKRPPAFSNR
ncbi:MAG: enoyl-CoA hydratase/isomerase family protein [Rhodospirillales bacterium]|nr:enoyl-CoA hydratase/isomerase family protein [Rhodospirillales bacterium]